MDFKNAFNNIRRDKILEAAKQYIPEIFPFVYSCYSASSTLCYQHDIVIQSAEVVQQCDPLGPLLFCLVIHSLALKLRSELKVIYLDDGSLGGTEEDVINDIELIEQEASALGLYLNHSKSEMICAASAGTSLLSHVSDLCRVSLDKATLLGSPVGSIVSIDTAIRTKNDVLSIMKSRLCNLSKQDFASPLFCNTKNLVHPSHCSLFYFFVSRSI